MPSLRDLLAAAFDQPPVASTDPQTLLEWRGKVHAVRHALPDDSRGAHVADALLNLIRDLATLGTRPRTEDELEFQDVIWRFARLKGESIQEASAAATEIQKRLSALSDARARAMMRELYLRLAMAEMELLQKAE